MPNLTDELSTAKERRRYQFGTAVLVWYGKSVEFDKVVGSIHGGPSESDVTPVSLQSRTYLISFGTWKVRRQNQPLAQYPIIANRPTKSGTFDHVAVIY